MTKIEPGDYVLAYWLITSKIGNFVVRARRHKEIWQLEADYQDKQTGEVAELVDLTLELNPNPISPTEAYYQATHRIEDAQIKLTNVLRTADVVAGRRPRAKTTLLSFPIYSDNLKEIEETLKELQFSRFYTSMRRTDNFHSP